MGKVLRGEHVPQLADPVSGVDEEQGDAVEVEEATAKV